MDRGLFDLAGQVALVTGGNGGIGRGMARGLAIHGATVVIWGTRAEKNASATSELEALGAVVRSAQVDVSDEQAVKRGVAAILEEFGRIDQAIASAGINIPRRDMFEISREDFEQIQGVNVYGVFYTLREVARHMIERSDAGDPGGSLVSIASPAAILGAGHNQHYGASKGAVLSLTRAMAVELAPRGIRVNSVVPGWTLSDMTAPYQEAEEIQEIVGRVPAGRWGNGNDFSAIAVYLASANSGFHTGDAIVIDGGFTIV
jgi:NAD(P)-dependent dehydrogenase (short-subunit alcohol dehydrogenase family)